MRGPGVLTNPQSCWSPCNRHAIISAILFRRTVSSSFSPAGPCPRIRLATSSSRASTSTSRTTASATLSTPGPPPNTFATTRLASSLYPRAMSHRGVSGMESTSTACTIDGTAPSPTIHRQPAPAGAYSANSHPTMYATTCPAVMKSTLAVTSIPLYRAGATSAM